LTVTTPAARGQVLGLGGLFFKSPDPSRLREWYQRVLGLQFNSWGGIVFDPAALPAGSAVVFTPSAADSDYFAPSAQPFMFNLGVDDLDAVLARAAAAGATVLDGRASGEQGNFGWIVDCDGNKVELWQPPARRLE
jgi:predicted enzyme related to lactoylglutathione lyase